MPGPSPCDYAVIRVVPHVERGEFINVGIVLFCRSRRFLEAAIVIDSNRLGALAPQLDHTLVATHLGSFPRICAGTPDSGPIGQLPLQERFHWLVAPRSTLIQASPVHPALCDDPGTLLTELMATLVLSTSPEVQQASAGSTMPDPPSPAP